jgi:hypothetical protein
MTARWVCVLCVMERGLKGSELEQWPEVGDDEAIARHLADAHGIVVEKVYRGPAEEH